MNVAPIALFAYNRPDHTERALHALANCTLADCSRLYIFCDGAKKPADATAVNEVRRIARSRSWCGEVIVVEQEVNLGIEKSVIDGVTKICDEHGTVIVVEDDLVVSPHFLTYMNSALERYADDPKVMQVAGFMFEADIRMQEDALFLPFPNAWGWATWRRAWSLLDSDMRALGELRNSLWTRRRFNLDGAYDYFGMAMRQHERNEPTWDMLWYLTVFHHEGLVLYPKASLVRNNGYDGSGVHCPATGSVPAVAIEGSPVHTFPSETRISDAYPAVTRAIARDFGPTPRQKVARAVKAVVSKIGGASVGR